MGEASCRKHGVGFMNRGRGSVVGMMELQHEVNG
jgi:hypothetical protein